MQKAKFWIPVANHFTAKGRVSRLQYFVYSLIYLAVYFTVLVGAGAATQLLGKTQMDGLAIAVALTFTSYVYFCLDAKRLHDLNWPAFIAAILLIEPLISAYADVLAGFIPLTKVTSVLHIVDKVWAIGSGIVGLILLFGTGNKGTNRYGPDPLRPPAPPVDVF